MHLPAVVQMAAPRTGGTAVVVYAYTYVYICTAV